MSDAASDTPLGAHIKALIRQEGPISLSRYMALALGHPKHGYYMTRDPLGARGDFTTAPEISQMFGELIGLWAAHAWATTGAPEPVVLVELGPGRGTLMADALRAIGKAAPAFRAALSVHLVETSPVLREKQALMLASEAVEWHERIETLPEAPLIVIANEFFDALPIDQFVHSNGAWRERQVGLEEGRLVFGLSPALGASQSQPSVAEGAVLEVASAGLAVMKGLALRFAANGGAALIIDYGPDRLGLGDTLQAMENHAFVDPLARPGEADITAHVAFEALADAAVKDGLTVDFLASQADFLESLGIKVLAETLRRNATALQAETIDGALARLTDRSERGMGSLFKVLALRAGG
jgi:SAM-dependent MidA family methyltransferase